MARAPFFACARSEEVIQTFAQKRTLISRRRLSIFKNREPCRSSMQTLNIDMPTKRLSHLKHFSGATWQTRLPHPMVEIAISLTDSSPLPSPLLASKGYGGHPLLLHGADFWFSVWNWVVAIVASLPSHWELHSQRWRYCCWALDMLTS
jgi:hypothetical protein